MWNCSARASDASDQTQRRGLDSIIDVTVWDRIRRPREVSLIQRLHKHNFYGWPFGTIDECPHNGGVLNLEVSNREVPLYYTLDIHVGLLKFTIQNKKLDINAWSLDQFHNSDFASTKHCSLWTNVIMIMWLNFLNLIGPHCRLYWQHRPYRPFSFTSSIIPFSVYSRNFSVNYSYAGVHGAQRRWGVVHD